MAVHAAFATLLAAKAPYGKLHLSPIAKALPKHPEAA